MRPAWVALVVVVGITAAAAESASAAQSVSLERLWEASVPDFVQVAPVVADFQGRGQPGIVIVSKDRGMLCLFHGGGKPLATLRLSGEMNGGAAAADLDGDGAAEVIAADMAGNLKAWSPRRGVLWQARLDSGVQRSAPLAVDLVGDRRPEIVVGTTEGMVWCFDARGRVLWKHEVPEGWWPGWGLIAAPMVAANVDGAGRPEIVVASREAVICCLNADGRRRWTARLGTYCKIAPTIADFDDDGRLEVMVSCYSPHQNLPGGKAYLHCLDAATGVERWRADVGGGLLGPVLPMTTRTGTRALVVSGDGRVGILSKPDATWMWGDPYLFLGPFAARPARDLAGPNATWIWGDPKDNRKQAATPGAVLDFDGDGQTDVALLTRSGEMVVLDAGGAELARVGTRVVPQAPPAVADINGDGHPEIVIVGYGGRTECYRLPPGARLCTGTPSEAEARLAPKPRRRQQPAIPATSSRAPRLTGVTLKALWWNQVTASPAAVFTNHTDGGRHVEYDLSLEHPDGRLASKTGTLWLPAHGRSAVTVPYIELRPGRHVLRCALREGDGRLVVTATHNAPVVPEPRLPAWPPAAVARQDPAIASAWRMPLVGGKDFWHLVSYEPNLWKKLGLGEEPFIQQAMPRVYSSPPVFARDFALDSPVRQALLADGKPIMLHNQWFAPVSRELYEAFERDFGDRLIGFAVHEWAYGAVTSWADNGISPWTRAEGARRLADTLHYHMKLYYGRVYPGEGYRLPYHLAFREGAAAAYAEVGSGDIPATPLQVAVLRGAARQYGRPWGYYIAAWYHNSVTTYDTARAEGVQSDDQMYTGPDAGHSVSLMERMLYQGYLSGATFVQHESDAFHGSIWVEDYGRKGNYRMSPMGTATRRWFDFTRRHPDRGVAYAPFAVMIDANHGWCPADDQIWRALPPTEGERAMSQIANLFYPWQFSTFGERGFLTHGRFGDTVDFVSHEAAPGTLATYRVIMLLGDVPVDKQVASRLRAYVESGGTVLVSAGHKPWLLGAELARALRARSGAPLLTYTSGAKRAQDGAVMRTAPYAYWPLRKGVGRAWWTTSDGRPLVTEIQLGKGRVVMIAAPHSLDLTGRPLPLLEQVITRLYDGLLPVRVKGDIEFTLARNQAGWVIGLVNSKGVLKTPCEPAQTVGAGAQVEITAPWGASGAEEWTADTGLNNLSPTRQSRYGDGAAATGTRVVVTVPPGAVRVVLLKRG